MPQDLGGRGCLFSVAFIVAAIAAYIAALPVVNNLGAVAAIVIALGVFFLVGILYSVFAAGAVSFCKGLRALSFPDETSTWDHDTAARWGAVWPLSLAFWLFIFPFFFVINRLFRKRA